MGTWNYSGVCRNSWVQSPNRNRLFSTQHWMRENTPSQGKDWRAAQVWEKLVESPSWQSLYGKNPAENSTACNPMLNLEHFTLFDAFRRSKNNFFLEVQVEALRFIAAWKLTHPQALWKCQIPQLYAHSCFNGGNNSTKYLLSKHVKEESK